MVNLEERCPTGIHGLDKYLNGGFPRNRSILIAGSCGTGKTIFGVQFLYNGIVQYNEPGILVSLEQDPKELKQDMLKFGFDLEKVENEGKLIIIDASLSRFGIKPPGGSASISPQIAQPPGSMSLLPDEFNIERILEIVVSKSKRIEAKRVVIDSLPALDFMLREKNMDIKHLTRQLILSINYRLKLEGLTVLLITEIPEEKEALSAHGVESYVTDGVIVMKLHESLDSRVMQIRKMRQTKHSLRQLNFEITDRGIEIYELLEEKKKAIF
ncbi:MAG: ATPase [Candidatus Altiarchaeales archaeon]|nr:MAG: ATPase [Candidatus Altiarchaeales archaeon]RLI94387.1 MAG: ATPase [Candidatus Altiarchaeales archaeon]HDO82021.1 ATPase [Candidatus Altiarchaeales archaeon]HEX54670.1 ATPase [Candidatus Altiarchaeales archaeon]